MKSTITEIKNSLEGLTSRFEQAKERINKLEDKTNEIIQLRYRKNKKEEK